MHDELKTESRKADTPLEALQLTLQRLEGIDPATDMSDEWAFGDWNRCTCGHIYTSAVGGPVGRAGGRAWTPGGYEDRPSNEYLVTNPVDVDGLYEETLHTVVGAWVWLESQDRTPFKFNLSCYERDRAHIAVSDLTEAFAGHGDVSNYDAAIQLLTTVIGAVEGQQVDAMQQLAHAAFAPDDD